MRSGSGGSSQIESYGYGSTDAMRKCGCWCQAGSEGVERMTVAAFSGLLELKGRSYHRRHVGHDPFTGSVQSDASQFGSPDR